MRHRTRGSVTPRAEMAGKTLRWANEHPELGSRGQSVGALDYWSRRSRSCNYVQQGSTDFYASSLQGAYQAFFDSNIQADFVAVADIDAYKLLYVAYPVMLKSETVARLKKYVAQGGTLIWEGLPAYFGDHGHVGTAQPNYGLDDIFGAQESYVEFNPDILKKLMFEISGSKIYGRYFRQEYILKGGGEAVGTF